MLILHTFIGNQYVEELKLPSRHVAHVYTYTLWVDLFQIKSR